MQDLPLIDFDHVTFRYEEADGAPPAVSDITFRVGKGEFLAVLGSNGSGKSTLAKLANGILVPQKGSVRVLGAGTDAPQTQLEAKKTVGVVFQNPDNQIVASIVEEDVAFGPENLSLPPREIRKRVDEALAAVGMTDYAKHETHKLSGGQKQKVAIAGMIAMRPECLILDEPTAMLDPRGRNDVMQTLSHLHEAFGISIVLITHFMEEALSANRVLLMHNGALRAQVAPKELFSDPALVTECGLTLPDAVAFTLALKKRGIPFSKDVFSEAELIDALTDLLQSGVRR